MADYKFDEHEMCPACIIGKSKMQNVLGPAKRATRPLGKMNFDLIVSTIPSIEGYYYGALSLTTILDKNGCMDSRRRIKPSTQQRG